jgi:polysaccharide export outer membrane protein
VNKCSIKPVDAVGAIGVQKSSEVRSHGVWRRVRQGMLCALAVLPAVGCEVNSYFDPSRTGRFMETPTTMPVLERIDAIEPSSDLWGQTTGVLPEDLIPSNLSYRIHPGDQLKVEFYELYATSQWYPVVRRVDAGGYLRLPELGEVLVAGRTAQELQNELEQMLESDVMNNPTVDVSIESGGAFTYTVYGHLASPGRFTLQDPTLSILEALSMAGTVPLSTKWVYVVRTVNTSNVLKGHWERDDVIGVHAPEESNVEAPDINSLIKQLENVPSKPSPGAYGMEDEPLIDVDDLDAPVVHMPAAVDVDAVQSPVANDVGDNAFIYVPEKDEWVRVKQQDMNSTISEEQQRSSKQPNMPAELVLERVIKVPYARLMHGDNSYNIIIRPGDQVYIDGPPVGIVYISGEVLRPGVYNLPTSDPLTLSRLIAAAGGLGSLAVPDRVDLTRMVGEHREATVRMNLAAIRRRTEPDIYLKPNDHIHVGTSWMAYPLAVFRNGLRMNYGFGFLLDRNFGNDVFGPPPSNIGR